ncbi:MAG TPA: nucleotidyltransferase family protein [Methylomirabilota bacterium]|nr:nucleotidyltransferase family protein [Methylomirabilota bacterium]
MLTPPRPCPRPCPCPTRPPPTPESGIEKPKRPLPHHRDTKAQRCTLSCLCRRWHIRRLALFGSVLRDDHRPDSDIDVLVEFEPGHVPGFGFITIQDELTEIFGRQVDLHTPSTLSKYFRDDVLDRAKTLYDAA